ncbi:MAG: maltooligosyl trehalose synthase [Nocardioidaceae bacterium]|nr:maltooligosyl trehalose synthase [Nocardioidaceae bacterium]
MRVPTSTYRVQVTASFDLHATARLLPYLRGLGVDWVYLSPLLAAEPGSDHGYDVVAHDRIDPTRGGAEGLAAVSAEAKRLGMGVLVDIVPNHVGVATPAENAWWWDVLRLGRDSAYASFFDIDWDAGDGRLRIPVVGDDDEDAIRIDLDAGEVRYHDHRYPLAPGTSRLEEQHYELCGWRSADDRLNYRRFFAVNTLAALRVEDRAVFDASHVEIKRWFDERLVDGLRVDHPDGLRDPKKYLDDLADLTGSAYVLVEKILEPGETLQPDWATAGTTGYDALGLIDRVLTDPAGQRGLDALEARLRRHGADWAALIHGTKRDVADGILGSEVNRIVRELAASAGRAASGVETKDAVAELIACFPVYRSYLPAGREHLDEAFAAARAQRPDLADAFDALEPLLSDPTNDASIRFQQTSGMVMAKGVEDCAFYRYSRLTSLNEVGGDPSEYAVEVGDFHAAMTERQKHWPHAMTTTSTHDTKRGEDVRARIGVLAEVPDAWAHTLDRLLALAPLPDPGFASLLWQAVLGAWPASRERLHAYAEKAMREAGDRTTWTEPDVEYESAVHGAVDVAFDDHEVRTTLDELLERIAGPGWSNALSAKLVALTMPGVPDVYQGSELWEQSLVDPDNRRPVDFEQRRELLRALLHGAQTHLSHALDDPGAAKLAVVRAALTLRRDRPQLFTTYAGLDAHGSAAEHLLAFDRGGAITLATRLPVGLAVTGWGDTALDLPDGTWVEQLSGRVVPGGTHPVADLLGDLPVALLAREDV